MTLEQLRIFVAVAEREHMTRAAEALRLTQSAASSAIQSLEMKYDTKLFNRIGRGIELTEAGRLFLEEAKAVLVRAAAAETVLSEISGLKVGLLRIGASLTVASYWLPHWLVGFRKQYPQIELRVDVANTTQIAASILDGGVDLGFVEGSLHEPLLSTEVVAEDHLVIIVHPQHPLAQKRNICAKDLLTSQWVAREPGSGTRSEFEHALAELGVDPSKLRIALQFPLNEAVLSAVEAGAGVAAVSELVAEKSLLAGSVVRIPISLPTRPFYVVQHRERHRTRAAEALLSMLRQDRRTPIAVHDHCEGLRPH